MEVDVGGHEVAIGTSVGFEVGNALLVAVGMAATTFASTVASISRVGADVQPTTINDATKITAVSLNMASM